MPPARMVDGKQLSTDLESFLFIVIAKQFDIRPVYNSPWAIS